MDSHGPLDTIEAGRTEDVEFCQENPFYLFFPSALCPPITSFRFSVASRRKICEHLARLCGGIDTRRNVSQRSGCMGNPCRGTSAYTSTSHQYGCLTNMGNHSLVRLSGALTSCLIGCRVHSDLCVGSNGQEPLCQFVGQHFAGGRTPLSLPLPHCGTPVLQGRCRLIRFHTA